MAQRRRKTGILPAPPDVPVPPAGEPDTALSGAKARHHRISEAAYYRAQRRGFRPGGELDDWFEAEKEIDIGE
jgi:hypothetical protein